MKYIIQFRDTRLPISEEEVPKVIQAMNEKKIVMLKCGVIHGSFISAILKDINGEKGYSAGFDASKELKRKDYICDFSDVMESINKDQLLLE